MNDGNTRFIPVTDWNKFHVWPPLGGLRHLVFHGASNGFDAVVRRCGRRVLIDERAFFDWVERQGVARGAIHPVTVRRQGVCISSGAEAAAAKVVGVKSNVR
jgi:hypothetical protein